ncbi:MAG TPA: 3'-5' exonuclease [Gemmatimonadaceae bacterium]|nr:3'-5' exonuclease [Gemmatimonadaceae bacterium]
MPTPLRIAPDTPLHELEYVVVDCETTGRSYARSDRVTDVAAVVVRNGRVEDTFSALVNPRRAIPPAIARLTGITNSMVAVAPPFEDVAHHVAAILSSRVFVAHNVAFDWGFVGEELFRATGRGLSGERLCTVRLARKLLSHLPRRNLDAVSAYYGIPIHGRHRALGDAVATAHVFTRMLDELGRQGVHTWGDLRTMFRGPKKKRRRWSALPSVMTDWHIA